MTKDDAEPNFSAILTPNRSLSPKGFILLMSLVSIICFGAGFVFLLMGAWPVFGFLGLDVLIVYIAFKLNYKDARAHELVQLTHKDLSVTKVDRAGRKQSWAFNPYWVKFTLNDIDEYRSELILSSHGKFLKFGEFLSKNEKHDFARALSSALQDCRNLTPES